MDIRTRRLNEAFRASGMTQTELCKRTGITQGAFSSYLSGRYFPKQRAIELLANVLNVSIPYLMGYEDVVMEENGMVIDHLTDDGILIEKIRKLSPPARRMLNSIIDTMIKEETNDRVSGEQ